MKIMVAVGFLAFVLLYGSAVVVSKEDTIKRIQKAPHKYSDVTLDGTGAEAGFRSSLQGFDERKTGGGRVSVFTVACLTLGMAAATGLGALPFFFVELEPQWAGVCNGLAAGVMLAASFDLVQEGQTYGSGNWVVVGTLTGGLFIWLCKKFLEQYGEVSMLDLKGADASKVVLVIGIMTLHSFGEGSGVGVSFAGSKGLSQGLLITLAIAVHNIPEGLAVSMVLASRGVSAQNAMLWSIITSLPQVLNDSFTANGCPLELCLMFSLLKAGRKPEQRRVGIVDSTIKLVTSHEHEMPIENNLREGLLRWFGHIQHEPVDVPPIVAVPSFLCADAFHKLLPFCTGFAAGCMIWMVIAEVLPDAFKVASASILSVAFMETLSTVIQSFSRGYNVEDSSGFLVSLLFGLGPLLGGIILVIFGLAFCLPHSVLIGVASGIAFLLAAWRPLQLMLSSKMGFFTISLLLALGAASFNLSTSGILKVARRKKTSVNELSSSAGLSLSALTLQSFFACGAICLHALAEGLPLGVAAPKASGFGQHMILPVSLHGLPRGAAVASCIFGATGSWRGALAAAALTGIASPTSAIGAILTGIGYNGLDYWMVFACGTLIPSFDSVFRRSLKLDARKSIYGLLLGLGFASICLTSTRMVCLHTHYCNSAPEAVT